MKVICGNNIDILKQYPDNYFDAIVTDPPYGLGKEPNAEELMKDWIEKGYHEITGTGFMGKEWDAFIPQPIFWKEVFRVLKYGGHVLSFFGTRTYDWGVMSMRFAGFEIRDCIQWLYGSGFPKSHNISKAIEGKILNGSSNPRDFKKLEGEKSITKLGTFNNIEKIQGKRDNDVTGRETTVNHKITTDQAKEWDGWGTALKPANEPIVLARKPLEKGLSIAENVLKWGTGAINIDGCRVSHNEPIKTMKAQEGGNKVYGQGGRYEETTELKQNGRFPANLILTHHPECECIGAKKVKGTYEDGNETIEDWNCVDDCPIKILDEQSGILKSGAMDSIAKGGKFNTYGNMNERRVINKASEGGASRFFYVAKASQSEKNKGLNGFDKVIRSDRNAIENIGANNPRNRTGTAKVNHHPTVKPVKLMQYLVRLITPQNGIVLDPFCGSGTTGVACKLEGFKFLGLEQDVEYSKIAAARIDTYVEETIIIKNRIIKEIDNNQINLNFEFD